MTHDVAPSVLSQDIGAEKRSKYHLANEAEHLHSCISSNLLERNLTMSNDSRRPWLHSYSDSFQKLTSYDW